MPTTFNKTHRTVKKNKEGGHESDQFQTPLHALPMLSQYLDPSWVIWEPACGKGNIVRYFTEECPGRKALFPENRCWGTDFLMGPEYDFFTTEVHKQRRWDCIVTNPPWSLKMEFTGRCLDLGKPFALLVPITYLESTGTFMVDHYGLEIIMPWQRIAFETPHDGWWCHYGPLSDDNDRENCLYKDQHKFDRCSKCGGTAGIRRVVSVPQKKSMWITKGLNIGSPIVYYDMRADMIKFGKDYEGDD